MVLKQKIKEYTNKPAFSTIVVVISILFALIPCFICLFLFLPENKWNGLLFFVPTIFIAILYFLSGLYRGKYSNLLKILVTLLNIFILLFIQTICAFGFLLICATCDANTIINHPKRYSVALKSLKGEKKIIHFPKNIPDTAQNAVLFIDEAQFNYVKIEGPFEDAKKYENNHPRDFIFGKERNNIDYKEYRDKIEGYKIYVIGDKSPYDDSLPCEYGIAVNDKTNTIIYYASNPD